MEIQIENINNKYKITIICPKCHNIIYMNENIAPENFNARLETAKKQQHCVSCNIQNHNLFAGIPGKQSRMAAIYTVSKF